MSNKTGNSCSGPKRRRSSARLDSEPLPERSCPRLDSTIETVLRKAVRLRMDADKAHANLLCRVKRLEEHLSKDTIPTGLRIASIQAKGGNVETLQAKFDEVVHEAEVKMLEATIENLRSEIKDHQEAIRTASANVDGTIARWKVELLENEILESKASSLVEAAVTFVEQVHCVVVTLSQIYKHFRLEGIGTRHGCGTRPNPFLSMPPLCVRVHG